MIWSGWKTTIGETRVSKRVIIFGAGSTGRGHIGELAYEAGWELVLVDRDATLVDVLRRASCYRVRLYGPHDSRVVTIDRYRVYHLGEPEAIIREALQVPLILTSVFSHNLREIAPLVARIVSTRRAAGVKEPLNVVCCENMQNSSSMLKSYVYPLLSGDDAAYAALHVGFPDCMISRIVPLAMENPVKMIAEDYNEWTVDATGFIGPPIDLPAMELVNNQAARLARKFFMHNSAHAICGYWGFHRGHTYIHEALADEIVSTHVSRAIGELAEVVAHEYGFTAENLQAYGAELAARGSIAELKDSVLRVVRDPLRKLSRTERLVAPAELAVRLSLACTELAWAIAAALHYYHPDDPQSVTMRRRLETEGAENAIPSILGLRRDHALVDLVLAHYLDPACCT